MLIHANRFENNTSFAWYSEAQQSTEDQHGTDSLAYSVEWTRCAWNALLRPTRHRSRKLSLAQYWNKHEVGWDQQRWHIKLRALILLPSHFITARWWRTRAQWRWIQCPRWDCTRTRPLAPLVCRRLRAVCASVNDRCLAICIHEYVPANANLFPFVAAESRFNEIIRAGAFDAQLVLACSVWDVLYCYLELLLEGWYYYLCGPIRVPIVSDHGT